MLDHSCRALSHPSSSAVIDNVADRQQATRDNTLTTSKVFGTAQGALVTLRFRSGPKSLSLRSQKISGGETTVANGHLAVFGSASGWDVVVTTM